MRVKNFKVPFRSLRKDQREVHNPTIVFTTKALCGQVLVLRKAYGKLFCVNMIEVAGIFQFRQPKYLLKELKHRWKKEVTKEKVSIKKCSRNGSNCTVIAKWKRTFVYEDSTAEPPAYSREKTTSNRAQT